MSITLIVVLANKQVGTLNVSKNPIMAEKRQELSQRTDGDGGEYQWYQHEGQGLPTPDAVTDLTRAHRDAQDSVGVWLEECCELKAGEWVDNTKIRTSYGEWCKDNGYEPKGGKSLSQSLVAHGLIIRSEKKISDGEKRKTVYGVAGLTIL